MKRYLTVGYGAAAYLLFLAAFLYLVAFMGNFWVPRTVDHGLSAPVGQAVLVNIVLLGLFGLQHSVMARPAFKTWWTRLVPTSIERSTYVMLSNLVLALLYWQWRTMPAVIWEVQLPAGRLALWTLFWLGWVIALASTFMVSHFDLFGLRQVYLAWRGKPYTDIAFHVRMLLPAGAPPTHARFRHRLLGGPHHDGRTPPVLIAMTGYILVATRMEERDLVGALGDDYRNYRREVPMLLPLGRRARGGPTQPAELH